MARLRTRLRGPKEKVRKRGKGPAREKRNAGKKVMKKRHLGNEGGGGGGIIQVAERDWLLGMPGDRGFRSILNEENYDTEEP